MNFALSDPWLQVWIRYQEPSSNKRGIRRRLYEALLPPLHSTPRFGGGSTPPPSSLSPPIRGSPPPHLDSPSPLILTIARADRTDPGRSSALSPLPPIFARSSRRTSFLDLHVSAGFLRHRHRSPGLPGDPSEDRSPRYKVVYHKVAD
ncbi:hypothetical protein MUK42_36323 [Musa troglodytarum]|uniref:Uncharacterized protein n=1 Tax=Musa troglodytarum TaxID=320322 RepID=A0A9E7EC89_9LILI|nr:hypothetical protein MUK42_36323 [Musa troglodytarum]